MCCGKGGATRAMVLGWSLFFIFRRRPCVPVAELRSFSLVSHFTSSVQQSFNKYTSVFFSRKKKKKQNADLLVFYFCSVVWNRVYLGNERELRDWRQRKAERGRGGRKREQRPARNTRGRGMGREGTEREEDKRVRVITAFNIIFFLIRMGSVMGIFWASGFIQFHVTPSWAAELTRMKRKECWKFGLFFF